MHTFIIPDPERNAPRAAKYLATITGIAASVLALAIAGCRSDSNPVEASTSTPDVVAGAAGSTFVAPLMAAWIDNYQNAHPKDVINYKPIGSGGGIDEFKKGWPAFAATEAPLSDDQIKEISPTVQVPATAGPVCIVYNLPGLARPLKLSSKAVAGIFLGSIISWQDPAIAKDNPGVALPKAAVVVLHRSDGSGTTNILTTYLNKVSHDWSSRIGQGLSVNWPVGLGGEGSKGILNLLKQSPGTVGYLELSYAKDNRVPVAAIQNNAGEFVDPTPQSTAAAIDAFQSALAADVRSPIVDPPSAAKGAYPIAGFTFLLIHKDSSNKQEQAVVRDFTSYAVSNGQDFADRLSYTKLPQFVQTQSRTLLTQLTANGQPLN